MNDDLAPRPDSGSGDRVVAHDRRGRIVKGSTRDFFPDRALFHIRPPDSSVTLNVRMNELKAVYFVRTLEGDPGRPKLRAFPEADPTPPIGRRIAVLFQDGELLVGYTQNYSGEKSGFFVYPADREGNNLRIFVLRAATKQVKLGPAADELVRTAASAAAPGAPAAQAGPAQPAKPAIRDGLPVIEMPPVAGATPAAPGPTGAPGAPEPPPASEAPPAAA